MIIPVNIQNIYFIGIGGIGMSALARYFHTQGALVSGYDRTRTPLTIQLEQSGIVIHYEENIDALAREADVVVYTPAVPSDHKELVWYRNNNYNVVKRSDILQWVTNNSNNICVAGTHGKTTTSTITAHILRATGYGCNAFLGGIAANYDTNFWSHQNNTVVVEADEYDRSFLKLSPQVAVITAMDPDHLDIYGTAEEFSHAFVEFAGKIKPGGTLISKFGLPLVHNNQITYSLDNESADVYATNIRVLNGYYTYDVIANQWQLKDVRLTMGGLHNIENSIAAIIVAKTLGIKDEPIKAAIAGFKGVKRRFEYILSPLESGGRHTLIDDYAHHPEELKALISGVRSLYPREKFVLVFQPHLYTRTRDQLEGFAEVLGMADEVILLPIYPAREEPIPGVASEMIMQRMGNKDVKVMQKQELLQWAGEAKPALLVMAGAGDIDMLLEEVKQRLIQE